MAAPAGVPVPIPGPSPRPRLALGQQPGQPPVGGPIARIGKHGRGVREREPGPDERPEAGRARRHVNPHRSGERVVVRDPEGRKIEVGRPTDQLLGMGGAPQEGVARDRLQLHVAGGSRTGSHEEIGARVADRTRSGRHPASSPPSPPELLGHLPRRGVNSPRWGPHGLKDAAADASTAARPKPVEGPCPANAANGASAKRRIRVRDARRVKSPGHGKSPCRNQRAGPGCRSR